MIINDPYVTGTILKAILECLKTNIEQESLPKDDSKFSYLCILLEIGQSTHHMIQTQKFSIDKKPKSIVSKFCPLLASVIVDDKIRKLTNEDDFDVLPESLITASKTEPISRKVYSRFFF